MNNDVTLESSSAINTHILKKFKIVFLGDQGVGKTSIIKRFIFDNFDENNSATIGVDLISKNITVDNKTVRLNLWDTAGQERFRCLIPGYIRDSNVAIAVYDITSIVFNYLATNDAGKTTFESLQGWINDVKSQREDDVLLAIAGCKSDLEGKREVTLQEAQKFAEEHKALFSEVSAKSGNNINQIFQVVVNQLLGGLSTTQIQVPASTDAIRDPKFPLNPNLNTPKTRTDEPSTVLDKQDRNNNTQQGGGGCCAQ